MSGLVRPGLVILYTSHDKISHPVHQPWQDQSLSVRKMNLYASIERRWIRIWQSNSTCEITQTVSKPNLKIHEIAKYVQPVSIKCLCWRWHGGSVSNYNISLNCVVLSTQKSYCMGGWGAEAFVTYSDLNLKTVFRSSMYIINFNIYTDRYSWRRAT